MGYMQEANFHVGLGFLNPLSLAEFIKRCKEFLLSSGSSCFHSMYP